MKKIYFTLLLFLLIIPLKAQFFTSTFYAEPSVPEFDHVKVHHHHEPHDKYHGDLTMTAYTKDFMLWEAKAEMIEGYRADFFTEKFGESMDIKTVYELKVALDGIEEDYVLMGYESEKGHPVFLVVEEIFEDESEQVLKELEKYALVTKHDHKKHKRGHAN